MQSTNLASAIKGVYKHEQVDGFLMAKEYIFLKEAEKKCLLQRFYNETALTIRAFEFELVELDIAGQIIQKRKFRYSNLCIVPNDYYSLPEGIVVSSECVDFKIEHCQIATDQYVYRIKHGKMQVYYDRRKRRNADLLSSQGDGLTVNSYAPRFGRLYGATAAMALISSVAVCLYLLFLRL